MVGCAVGVVGTSVYQAPQFSQIRPKVIRYKRKNNGNYPKLQVNANRTINEIVLPRFMPPNPHSIEKVWEEQTVEKILVGEGESPIHVIFNSGAYSKNLSLLLVALKHEVGSFDKLTPAEAATILKTAAALDKENPNLYIGANCSVVLENFLNELGLSHKLAQSIRKFFHMQVWDYSEKPINRLTNIPGNLKDLLRGSSYTYEWSKKLIQALKENKECSSGEIFDKKTVLLTNHGVQFVFQNQNLSSLCEKDLEGFTNFVQLVVAGTNSHLEQMVKAEIKAQKDSGQEIDLQKIMNLGGQFTFFFKQKGSNLILGIRPVFKEGGVLEAATSAMGESTILERTNSPVEPLLLHKLVTGLAEVVIPVLKKSLNGEINHSSLKALVQAHPEAIYQLTKNAQERVKQLMQKEGRPTSAEERELKQLRHYLLLVAGCNNQGLTAQNLS